MSVGHGEAVNLAIESKLPGCDVVAIWVDEAPNGYILDFAIVRQKKTGRLVVIAMEVAPLAGAEVERGDGITPMAEKDIPKFLTDANGLAAIAMAQLGPQLLAIDHKVVPSRAPELAATDLYNATLFFVLADRKQ